MVFQEPLLFDTTVFENVAAGLKIRGVSRGEIDRTVPEYLERFGIGHLAKRSARKLSGGEAQRTSLARAFVTQPEIVFLDEPFSALDPPTREALTGDLERILRETHTTAIASTHDQTEALRLADRIAVVNEGRIAQIGPVAEVMNRPADEFVASFVGVETVLPGRVLRTSDGVFTAAVEGGEIQAVGHVRTGDGVLCCIRPEHVTLSTNTPSAGVQRPERLCRNDPEDHAARALHPGPCRLRLRHRRLCDTPVPGRARAGGRESGHRLLQGDGGPRHPPHGCSPCVTILIQAMLQFYPTTERIVHASSPRHFTNGRTWYKFSTDCLSKTFGVRIIFPLD